MAAPSADLNISVGTTLSRKIRAVNKVKIERDERLTTNVPYGYIKNPGDLKAWIIDEEAAQAVKRIFTL